MMTSTALNSSHAFTVKLQKHIKKHCGTEAEAEKLLWRALSSEVQEYKTSTKTTRENITLNTTEKSIIHDLGKQHILEHSVLFALHPKNAWLFALFKKNQKKKTHVGQTLRKTLHLLLADMSEPKIK